MRNRVVWRLAAGFSETRIGVDVSPGMLAQAEVSGFYIRLVHQDIVEYLIKAPENSVDLVAAVYVFRYLEDLQSVVEFAHRIVKTDGLLAFTVEATDDDAVTLARSPRYRHPVRFLEALCNQHRYRPIVAESQIIRTEGGLPCWGWMMVWSKREAE